MVILGVAGCSALLLCGFGIENTINYGFDLELENYIPYNVTVSYSDYSSHAGDLQSDKRITAVDEYAKYSVMVQGKNTLSSYVYVMPSLPEIIDLGYDDDGISVSLNLRKTSGLR